MDYATLFILVFLAGLIPAFGPPSWIIAVFFYHRFDLSFFGVVVLTALATSLGRIALGYATGALRNHIPERFIANLEYAKKILEKQKNELRLAIGLFVVSPLPSAQLFEAAALLRANLISLGSGFFIGRLVSISFYLLVSKAVASNSNELWKTAFTSPWAFSAEIICLIAIIALFNFQYIYNKVSEIKSRKSKG